MQTVVCGIIAKRDEKGNFLPAIPIEREVRDDAEPCVDFAEALFKEVNARRQKAWRDDFNKRMKELGLK